MIRLSYSNIAWTPHDSPEILQLLKQHGISGIEVAPTKVWPEWQGATRKNASKYRHSLAQMGFQIPALQAVLFGKSEARLFDDDGEHHFVEHLTMVAELSGALEAPVVVLGAPRQRDRGELDFEQAVQRAIKPLRKLAQHYYDNGSCLCIEPNPRQYACNFVINIAEAEQLVKAVDHPGFGLHLDAAAMFLEGDDLKQLWPYIGQMVRHFHISEPDLGDFVSPQVNHLDNLRFLVSQGYDGWFSVEMREPEKMLAEAGPWRIIEELT